MGNHIGFISTRFSGTDGVSLEAFKWAEVFRRIGYECFWFAGELDVDDDVAVKAPLADFRHGDILRLHRRLFGASVRTSTLTEEVHDLRRVLKAQLDVFVDRFDIDFLVVENALAIPLNIPLGLAITETIAERALPVIAHHHDFYWERDRFAMNAVGDYLRTAFPPALPQIRHVVINSDAQSQLAHRCGIVSTVIPNIMDFEAPVPSLRDPDGLRRTMGFSPEDILILQPTRVIQRKGIEHAIDLVRDLADSRCKLVISHEAGDEGFAYRNHLIRYAQKNRVDLRWIPARPNGRNGNGDFMVKHKALWNVYQIADFVTFPSQTEGFGNAFLEAIFFGKPLMVNRYGTFVRDLEPLGFDLIPIDGFVDENTVHQVRQILDSPLRQRRSAETNFGIARTHFSYKVFNELIRPLIPSLEHPKTRTAADSPKVIPLNPPYGDSGNREKPCGPSCRRATRR